MSNKRENTTVNEDTGDQEFTLGYPGSNLATNENLMNVKTLERCFNERIDREMGNIVDTVEDRIQNTILTAIDSNFIPKIELAIKSKNASSGRDAISVTANSECKEHIGITAAFEILSEMNNTVHVLSTNDETRNYIPDEVSDPSVPGTHFDRQPHTHHRIVQRLIFVHVLKNSRKVFAEYSRNLGFCISLSCTSLFSQPCKVTTRTVKDISGSNGPD